MKPVNMKHTKMKTYNKTVQTKHNVMKAKTY